MTDNGGDSAHIELKSIRLSLGRRQVFRDLNCRVPRAQISVLLGGSGTGKSTFLRLVAGLQRPDRGVISIGGEQTQDFDERALGRVRRQIGMLFQNGALLDSVSVFDNVALPLREHTQSPEPEIAAAVHRRLTAVGLEDVDDLLPRELSGGMLRRVALARAIIMDPEILLCDEPFSGLDPPNVARIEALLTRLNRELGLTLIVSSHHMASASRMGNQLVLLIDGGAVCGSPSELAASSDPRIVAFFRADATDLGAAPEAGETF